MQSIVNKLFYLHLFGFCFHFMALLYKSGKFLSSARQTVCAHILRGLNLFADGFYQNLGATSYVPRFLFWHIKCLTGL